MSVFLRFAIAIVIAVFDQVTKIAASQSMTLHETIQVMPFFNIFLAHNYGAAFSFLNIPGGTQRWFFTAISLIASVFISVWLYRMTMREKWLSLSFSLILGGAVGNLIDRAYHGYVVDFIQVYYKNSYFPTFNIADSAIFCGAALMLGLTFFGNETDAEPKK